MNFPGSTSSRNVPSTGAQRCFRSGVEIRRISAISSYKLHLVSTQNLLWRKLVHSYALVYDVFWLPWLFGAPATQNRPLLSYCRPYLLEHLQTNWRHILMSRGILAARSISHFWRHKRATFNACKILNFYRRILKLWNCAFQIVIFSIM